MPLGPRTRPALLPYEARPDFTGRGWTGLQVALLDSFVNLLGDFLYTAWYEDERSSFPPGYIPREPEKQKNNGRWVIGAADNPYLQEYFPEPLDYDELKTMFTKLLKAKR